MFSSIETYFARLNLFEKSLISFFVFLNPSFLHSSCLAYIHFTAVFARDLVDYLLSFFRPIFFPFCMGIKMLFSVRVFLKAMLI